MSRSNSAAQVVREDKFQLGVRRPQEYQEHQRRQPKHQRPQQQTRRTPAGAPALDSNAVPCPSYSLLQVVAACLTPRLAISMFYLLSAMGITGLFGLYAHVTPSTEAIRSALLLWYFQCACASVAALVVVFVIPAIRRVLLQDQGGLVLLGLGVARISEADKRYLDWWAAFCSSCALVTVGIGWLYISIPLLDPDRKSFPDPFNPERPWDFLTVLHYSTVGLAGCTAGPVLFAALLSIQVGTKLGTDAINDVMVDVQRLSPSQQEEWAEAVEQPIIRIARHTVAVMSDHWGILIGGTCPLCWALSLSFFTGYVRYPQRWHLLPGSFLAALLPIGVAWPLAVASTRCEQLIDNLNEKRLDDLGHHRRIDALEHALRHCNCGQGLSFIVFGVAVSACGSRGTSTRPSLHALHHFALTYSFGTT